LICACSARAVRRSHLGTVRDKLVSRTISRTDFFSRKYIRLTLPMAMVITPPLPLKTALAARFADAEEGPERARRSKAVFDEAAMLLDEEVGNFVRIAPTQKSSNCHKYFRNDFFVAGVSLSASHWNCRAVQAHPTRTSRRFGR
jgi:hypothetical protein